MALKVFKFGGALLNNLDGFKQLKAILQQETAHNANNASLSLVIIVSALQKTTSKLLKTAQTAELYGEKQANIIADDIFYFHRNLAENLISNPQKLQIIIDYLNTKKIELNNLIRGIFITKELSPRTKDLVLSFGEILASKIVEIYLSETFPNVLLFDITDVLRTDNNFGAATPNIEKTKKNIANILLPIMRYSKIIVTQGFIASTSSNEITTMGYESSNLTATILAGLTEADEFIIWSDTEGIRQIDPKLCKDNIPPLVSKLDYDSAEYLAYSGLKLIHPPMINYLRQFGISVKYKSGYHPDGECTIISKELSENDYNFLIYCENLTTYNKSNVVNRFDLDIFPPMAWLLEHPSNVVYIGPDEHLYVSNFTPPLYVESDLLEVGLQKKGNINAITFINIPISNFLGFLAQINALEEENLLNVFINPPRRTAIIYYKEQEASFVYKCSEYLLATINK